MSALTIAGVLTAIPWKQIFEHGPGLLGSARNLFKRSQPPGSTASLQERLERLERNEREQARLIEQLVERQELLLAASQVINFRLKALFVCTLITAAGLIACVALLLTR